MTRQTSFQLTEATEMQLDYLKAKFGGTTDVIRIAIDRMAQQERMNTMTVETYTAQEAVVAMSGNQIATWAKVDGVWQYYCMGRADWLLKPDATINDALIADFPF